MVGNLRFAFEEANWHSPESAIAATIKGAALDGPPEVARVFVKDMRAYFAEESHIERDAFAANQMAALQNYQ